jgi:hypothetical protein
MQAVLQFRYGTEGVNVNLPGALESCRKSTVRRASLCISRVAVAAVKRRLWSGERFRVAQTRPQRNGSTSKMGFPENTGDQTTPENITPLLAPLEALQHLLSLFSDRGVIVGGIAVSLLGSPRYTADLDAVFLGGYSSSRCELS